MTTAHRRVTHFTVDEHRLEATEPREPSPGAPWVVFLHEGLGSARIWRDFPGRVAAATGCGTLAYSRWGYGGADARPVPWPDDFLFQEATATLPLVLEHFGIARPAFYGHSDGATIALMYAAAFPSACAGVVSVAAHVMLEELSLASIANARQRFVDGHGRSVLSRQHGDHTEETMFGWADTWLRSRQQGWDMRESLAAIRCPVLAIQGRDDRFGTLDQVDEIVRGVSGPAEGLVLDECGHVPHREKPTEVLAAVSRFIRRL